MPQVWGLIIESKGCVEKLRDRLRINIPEISLFSHTTWCVSQVLFVKMYLSEEWILEILRDDVDKDWIPFQFKTVALTLEVSMRDQCSKVCPSEHVFSGMRVKACLSAYVYGEKSLTKIAFSIGRMMLLNEQQYHLKLCKDTEFSVLLCDETWNNKM